MKDVVYWIWLSLSVTPGSETFRKLIEKFAYPEAVYSADKSELTSCIGSRSHDLSSLCNKELSRAVKIAEFCEKKGVGILTYSDENFPKALREINTPPVLLYYRGVLPSFNDECIVAIVGTRRLTDYGRRNAFVIGHDLATAGATIVSGMAKGIDGVSHAGSLSAGGINIAFLGSGIDVCYPEEHKRLAREIVKSGCVMTEYAPGTKPKRRNFPVRNRLIAGISAVSVVLEGTERSGAIITARYAKQFGKTVYALPGNVDNKTSEVTNLLIKNGAKLITSPDDIIADLEFVYLGKINPFKLKKRLDVNMNEVFRELEISCVAPSDNIFSTFPSKKKKKIAADAEEPERISVAETKPKVSIENMKFDNNTLKVYNKIPIDASCSIDSLADAELPMHVVMKSLFKLEMSSCVTMLPGEMVKRN